MRAICQIFTLMFSLQSMQFWVGIINQRQRFKVELSLAEKPLTLMCKALTALANHIVVFCMHTVPVCNTIVLMKYIATAVHCKEVVYVCVCVCIIWLLQLSFF